MHGPAGSRAPPRKPSFAPDRFTPQSGRRRLPILSSRTFTAACTKTAFTISAASSRRSLVTILRSIYRRLLRRSGHSRSRSFTTCSRRLEDGLLRGTPAGFNESCTRPYWARPAPATRTERATGRTSLVTFEDLASRIDGDVIERGSYTGLPKRLTIVKRTIDPRSPVRRATLFALPLGATGSHPLSRRQASSPTRARARREVSCRWRPRGGSRTRSNQSCGVIL